MSDYFELSENFVTVLKDAEETMNGRYIKFIKEQLCYIRLCVRKEKEGPSNIIPTLKTNMDNLTKTVEYLKKLGYDKKKDFFAPGKEGLCFLCEHQEYHYEQEGEFAICNMMPNRCPFGYLEKEGFLKQWRNLEDSVMATQIVGDNEKASILKEFYQLITYGDKKLTIEESFDVERRQDIYMTKFRDGEATKHWADGMMDLLTNIMASIHNIRMDNEDLKLSHVRTALKFLLAMPNKIFTDLERGEREKVDPSELQITLGMMKPRKDGNGYEPVDTRETLEFMSSLNLDEIERFRDEHARGFSTKNPDQIREILDGGIDPELLDDEGEDKDA